MKLFRKFHNPFICICCRKLRCVLVQLLSEIWLRLDLAFIIPVFDGVVALYCNEN